MRQTGRLLHVIAAVCVIYAMAFASALTAGDSRLTPEEILAGHLKSLGTPEQRAAMKTRVAEGTATMKWVAGSKSGPTAQGRAFLFSERGRYRVAMPFDYGDYWGEHILFDGSKSDVGFVQPGRRSSLGDFLRQYDGLLQEGLLGGALSAAWPLLDLEGKQAQLESEGLKRVGKRELQAVKYRMKKSADVTVELFFEPETMRHVRTLYSLMRSSAIGATIARSSSEEETHFTLEETFDDFKPVDGVVLPHHWTMNFSVQAKKTEQRKWDVTFTRITNNEKISPSVYVIDKTD